ncbi:MAG: hypothetical protein HQM11_06535 [SAR324 cluster bacterium]|nr:hypothetical protein [SAR324 cluster bacterium]
MNDPQKRKSSRTEISYESLLLSQVVTEKKTIRVTFLDGDILIQKVQWHTMDAIGLKDGKVVNRHAIKFWEIVDE